MGLVVRAVVWTHDRMDPVFDETTHALWVSDVGKTEAAARRAVEAEMMRRIRG